MHTVYYPPYQPSKRTLTHLRLLAPIASMQHLPGPSGPTSGSPTSAATLPSIASSQHQSQLKQIAIFCATLGPVLDSLWPPVSALPASGSSCTALCTLT